MDSLQTRVLFSMPAFAGHVNPTLGVSRELVNRGCKVDFMCTCNNLKEAIEDTGATFHLAADWQPELYNGRHSEPPLGVGNTIMKEYAITTRGTTAAAAFEARLKVSNVILEMQLPGALRFLQKMRPHVVVYDPMVSCTRDAYYAAKLLGIAAVSVLTVAGPGTYADHITHGSTPKAIQEQLLACECHIAATNRLNATYPNLQLPLFPQPCALLEAVNTPCIVTTSEKLAQAADAELDAAHKAQGTTFCYLGPLLDQEGAVRAGCVSDASEQDDKIVDAVKKAKRAGRQVALIAMGTVLTSNCAHGWNGRPVGEDGVPRGLSGRELCQAAWGGAFDGLRSTSSEEGPLIVVSLGPREGALGSLFVPPNALVSKSVPQVDVLRAGVDVFVTHGGQNSFMEAISNSVPVVVCPGFGDQIMNSEKAEKLGIGLKVSRPDCEPGCENETSLQYRRDVAEAVSKVLSDRTFHQNVTDISEELRLAGGVRAAADLCISCAAQPCIPSLDARKAEKAGA